MGYARLQFRALFLLVQGSTCSNAFFETTHEPEHFTLYTYRVGICNIFTKSKTARSGIQTMISNLSLISPNLSQTQFIVTPDKKKILTWNLEERVILITKIPYFEKPAMSPYLQPLCGLTRLATCTNYYISGTRGPFRTQSNI